MEGSWPAHANDVVLYEDLSSMKLESSVAGCSVFTAALENRNSQSVTLTVLTVDNEESKSRFIQEAALLKLLTHESIPKLIGICSVPNLQTKRADLNGRQYPGFIIEKDEGVTLERFLLDTEDKPSRKKPYPYHDILDVLIDVAEALEYLHSLRPKVIHRGISTATIRVISNDSKLSGRLHNFRSAILSAEEGTRVPRLGVDSFLKEPLLVDEEVLTMEFFRETLIPAPTSFPEPSQRPQPISPTSEEILKDPPSPKKQPQSSSSRKKLNNKRVSSKKKAKLITKTGSSSSLRNNRMTPDPKADQKRTPKSVGVEHQGQNMSSKGMQITISDLSFDALQDSSKEPSPLDCNNASITEPPSPAVLQDPLVEDSAKSGDLEIKTPNEDDQNSESVLSYSDSVSSTVTRIYRAESMNFLRKQAGVRLAPEMLEGNSYDASVDIFSFGIVIYKALTKTSPTAVSKTRGNVQFTFPDAFPMDVEQLISSCCHTKAELRPTAKEISDQLRLVQESGCLNALNKRWRMPKCFCGAS